MWARRHPTGRVLARCLRVLASSAPAPKQTGHTASHAQGRGGAVAVALGGVSAAALLARRTRTGAACSPSPYSRDGDARAVDGTALESASAGLSGEIAEGRDFAVFCRPEPKNLGAGSQKPPARLADFAELLGALGGADGPGVILLGEVHDDSVAHLLQLKVLRHCLKVCRTQNRRLVLSLEMFESDAQRVLDEYVLHRAIREQDFLQDSRPWSNYLQDYRPLVEFCRENGVRVVAANAPRRYVSLVARNGSSALQKLVAKSCSKEARTLPPLPLPPASDAYRQKFVETIASQMPAAASDTDGGCPFIGFRAQDVREVRPEMMEAQLLWDHTMALSISQSARREIGEEKDPLVLHICGAFHCSYDLGIPEVLPLYAGGVPQTQAVHAYPWLPMDDVAEMGPKSSLPGVLTVVCWPACVNATLDAVRRGAHMPSLRRMGEWVVITEETWGEAAGDSVKS